jgi:hypothetical protein
MPRNPAIPIHTVPGFIAYARLDQARSILLSLRKFGAKNGNHAARRHCLISKGGDQLYLLIGERLHGGAVQRYYADRDSFPK